MSPEETILNKLTSFSPRIAVIGLGYVGLPLARLFATKYPVIGFDINAPRVAELMTGVDSTLEVEPELLKSVLKEKSEIIQQIGRASCRGRV